MRFSDPARRLAYSWYGNPDAGDTHQVSWNFGDGNVIAFHSTTDSGALAVSHAFVASGNYTVTMTIKENVLGVAAGAALRRLLRQR